MNNYAVTLFVSIKTKDEAFTPEFLAAFRKDFANLRDIEAHRRYLAELIARGIVHEVTQFVEGYGHLNQFVEYFDITEGEVEPS